MAKRVQLSWKPRAHGKTYCSPGCGAGCTRKAYNEAKQAARALAEKLGRGWSGRVWENLGWHYEAVSRCGRIHVSEDTHGVMYGDPPVAGCTAYLGEPVHHGGRWVACGSGPVEAVLRVIEKMRADLATFRDLLEPL